MLSIGRRLGNKNLKYRVTIRAVTKDCFGAMHSYDVGNANRASCTSNSCNSVVPVRQWPMMKIGGWILVAAIRRP